MENDKTKVACPTCPGHRWMTPVDVRHGNYLICEKCGFEAGDYNYFEWRARQRREAEELMAKFTKKDEQ